MRHGAVVERREEDAIDAFCPESVSGLNWFPEVKYCIQKTGHELGASSLLDRKWEEVHQFFSDMTKVVCGNVEV
ncbi:unnamed protein product [Thlaspi arvense]|uniref:Uncharacterized protein n=1 Tax=Thlaspi arvense TaxID=13288 RepID=A0AAU9ST08_THLAR|nr:unnamed protein product [Thlaspi arvense]